MDHSVYPMWTAETPALHYYPYRSDISPGEQQQVDYERYKFTLDSRTVDSGTRKAMSCIECVAVIRLA